MPKKVGSAQARRARPRRRQRRIVRPLSAQGRSLTVDMPEDPAPPVDTAMDERRPSTPGEDHPEPPPFTLEGKRVFVAHVDSRVGGVLGRAFRDAGCDVRGVRDGEKEVEFAKETYMADYDVSDGAEACTIADPNLSHPRPHEVR